MYSEKHSLSATLKKYMGKGKCTNQQTQQVLLDKLTDLQIINNFPGFYEISMFTTVSTTAYHLSLSWARWIQSTPSHSTASGFQTISLPSHACNMPCPPNSSSYDHPNNIWCELQKMEHHIMQFSAASCYLPSHNQNQHHQHHEQLGFRSNRVCSLYLEYVQQW
jgi:hypothetical protein